MFVTAVEMPEGNQLNFEIKHGGDGDDTRKITSDVCDRAFEDLYKDCFLGGERTTDGFWFRLDPNPGMCPS